MNIKTKGELEDYVKEELIRDDGYVYAFHRGNNTFLRILEIPESKNYSTQYAEILNNDIAEIDYGYRPRDFHYDGRDEVNNFLLKKVELSKNEILKIVLKYIYLIRPRLVTRTLLGYDLTGIDESEMYKHDPNTMSSAIQLNDEKIYMVNITKGKLEINEFKGEYVVKDYELNGELYNKALSLDKENDMFIKSARLYRDSFSIEEMLEEERFLDSYKKVKMYFVKKVNEELLKFD